jgi:hypothetical protein
MMLTEKMPITATPRMISRLKMRLVEVVAMVPP